MNDQQRQNEEITAQNLAIRIGVKYGNAQTMPAPPIDENLLTWKEINDLHIIPLGNTSFGLSFAYTERTNQSYVKQIKERYAGNNIDFVLMSESSFKELYAKFKAVFAPEVNPLEDLTQPLKQVPIKDLLVFLVTKAFQSHASDIHIEPFEEGARVRFRIDGRLHHIDDLEKLAYRSLMGDIKIKGNVNVLGDDSGQGGHINMEVKNAEGELKELNMRIEIISAVGGSDIVMRLFSIEKEFLTLENLGLLDYQRAVVDEVAAHPEGMMIVVGPTGSGKTSSLYSVLNQVNNEQNKIVTLEDPVEYELSGITQIPVETSRNDSFAHRLRSVVREDPDIIMVGEIRDPDTAVTALQASMTGHFVLSTFHANSAAAALGRLTDMIGRNAMVATSIKLVMAQRLVRKVCDDCKVAREPNEAELNEVFSIVQLMPAEKIGTALTQPKLVTAKGCDSCNGIGYKGRTVVLEQLRMNDDLGRILATGQARASLIEEFAMTNMGFVTIIQDALHKALLGLTTIDEVYRVLGKPDISIYNKVIERRNSPPMQDDQPLATPQPQQPISPNAAPVEEQPQTVPAPVEPAATAPPQPVAESANNAPQPVAAEPAPQVVQEPVVEQPVSSKSTPAPAQAQTPSAPAEQVSHTEFAAPTQQTQPSSPPEPESTAPALEQTVQQAPQNNETTVAATPETQPVQQSQDVEPPTIAEQAAAPQPEAAPAQDVQPQEAQEPAPPIPTPEKTQHYTQLDEQLGKQMDEIAIKQNKAKYKTIRLPNPQDSEE